MVPPNHGRNALAGGLLRTETMAGWAFLNGPDLEFPPAPPVPLGTGGHPEDPP